MVTTDFGFKYFILFLLFFDTGFSMIDYCKNNTFDHTKNIEKLHFSKENSDEEFGINNKFKCLHCCSHGYRSIEWFKDGQPYPWSTNVSTLIIHPESRNQTIYSQQLTFHDSGKYKCVVRNDTHVLQHEVLLKVSGPSISIGWPKTTYKPRDQKANYGDFARFYCEAFVGTIDLPDYQSEILWEKYDTNKSFIDNVSVVQENISREEKRVIGSYLSFTSVRAEDYGQYKCKVKNLEGQVVELSAWLKRKDGNVNTDIPLYTSQKIPIAVCEFYVIVLFLFFSAVASTITFLYFGSHFRLWSKGIFSSSLTYQENKKDLLIIYHEKDVGDALDNLLSTIKTKNRYSCSFHPLRNRLEIGEEELKAKANSYRGLLVIMTPELAGGSLTPKNIYNTIQFLQKVHFTVVCYFQQGLPHANDMDINLMRDALSKVHYLEGGNEKSSTLWKWIKLKFARKKKVPTFESLQELI